MYYNEVKSKTVNIQDQVPEIIKETSSSAYLDGKNLIGVVSAEYAMNLCIQKAENNGISMVAMNNANHFGIAGHYGLMAVEKGVIGMAFCNTSPFVVPTRSSEPILGTNPISFFAGQSPKGYDSSELGPSPEGFHLDMATSAVALGKIEMKKRLGLETPKGWIVDQGGHEITDPSQFNALLGLGGYEETSGYKGYGLSSMVEILCGVLSGSMYANNIRRWNEMNRPANLGQNFICINPKFFSDDFEKDLRIFSEILRNSRPIEGSNQKPIIPGDKARAHVLESLDSVEYERNVIDQIHSEIPESLSDRMPLI